MQTSPLGVLCGQSMLADAVARSLSETGVAAVVCSPEGPLFDTPVLAVFTGAPDDAVVLQAVRTWDPAHHQPCRAWLAARSPWSFLERVLVDHSVGVVSATSIEELSVALRREPEPPVELPRPLTNGLLTALCQLAAQPDSRALLARGLSLSPSTVDEQLRRIRDRLISEGAINQAELPDGYLSTERLIGWARDHRYDLGAGMAAPIRQRWGKAVPGTASTTRDRLPSGVGVVHGMGAAHRLAG